jgi:hypothetical protein
MMGEKNEFGRTYVHHSHPRLAINLKNYFFKVKCFLGRSKHLSGLRDQSRERSPWIDELLQGTPYIVGCPPSIIIS